jgi:hypothetical protein
MGWPFNRTDPRKDQTAYLMVYITFNDPPSGIYSGQVIDVCKFISGRVGEQVKLISFISLRDFRRNRSRIKLEYPDALVLPMFPGVHNWKRNLALLSFVTRVTNTGTVMGRGPFATWLALQLKNKRKNM